MNLTSTLRGLRRRPPNSALDLVEADVLHHAAYSPTEVIPVVPDETLLIEDPGAADAEPEPESEPLPDAGFVVLPTMCDPEQWLRLFGQEPAAAPQYGWVDVTDDPGGILIVEDFLGADIVEWCGEGVRVHTSDGIVTAHTGDRILRDEDGLHVQCARVFPDWPTDGFKAMDAAIAAGQGDCM
jgi:hypothetical protein